MKMMEDNAKEDRGSTPSAEERVQGGSSKAERDRRKCVSSGHSWEKGEAEASREKE